MKKQALLIGVNQYHLLANLLYARQDAEAVAEALCKHCGFSGQDITLMTCQSEGASRGLSRYIEHALMNLTDERDVDLLIFGFWGHGFAPVPGRRYLCGVDTAENDLERTAISFDVVKAKLAQVGAADTLLLLDCCQNRPPGRSAAAEPMTEGEEAALASMARDIQAASREKVRDSVSTVAILNACCEGQRAYEWTQRGHGIFTAHLLDAFDQGFGSIAPLASWLFDRVAKTSRDLHQQLQTPYVTIEGKGDIILPIVPSPRRIASADASGVVELLEEPKLRIETDPPGCSVSLDGKPVGISPASVPLSSGKHRVTAEKAGFKTWDRTVSFDGKGDATLEIELAVLPTRQPGDVVENSIGMKLAWIPLGEFLMGSPKDEEGRSANEGPQHRVVISKGFFMATTPVTQDQYKTVMGKNPSHFKGSDLPVEQVSWEDAVEFCSKLGKKEGRGYRLPTEAEWEYACRAGTTTRFYFGDYDDDLGYHGWFDSNSGSKTHTVAQKKPSAFGLYDMHGNVLEWCSDWYDADYYSNSPEVDPRGPKTAKEYRVLRGGSWYHGPGSCRSANRFRYSPDGRISNFGFRVVLLDF